jgi:hypothetical protein
MRWVALVGLLGGCDIVWSIDHVPEPPGPQPIVGRWSAVATTASWAASRSKSGWASIKSALHDARAEAARQLGRDGDFAVPSPIDGQLDDSTHVSFATPKPQAGRYGG